MTGTRRNAVAMLRKLPAVFDLRDMEIALGLSRKHAVQYCWRWSQSEYVKPVGPKAGAFYNLVADPEAEKLEKAVTDKVLRRPLVVIGATALHAHGWTTQRSHRTEIAVAVNRDNQKFPKIDSMTCVPRSLRWFAAVMPAAERGIGGFMVAPPEYALVDSIKSADWFQSLDQERKNSLRSEGGVIWHPDPDDIDPDVEDADETVRKILDAGKALGVSEDRLLDYVSGIDALSSAVPASTQVGHG